MILNLLFMRSVVLVLFGFGLLLGGPVVAQDADDAHAVSIQAEEVDDLETGDSPSPVSVPAGTDGTAESTLSIRTNAPPSNPRTVEAYLESSLPQGFTLEVDVVDDASVEGFVELSTNAQAVMRGLSSMNAPEHPLEYQVSVDPSVKTMEATVTVTYTLKDQ